MIIIGAAVVIVAIIVIVLLYTPTRRDKRPDQQTTEYGEGERQFTDAPRPDSDPELAEQIRTLWPHALKPVQDNKDEVRRQWQEFAKTYPENIYVPDEYRSQVPTEEQRAARQKNMELVTAVDAKVAAAKSAAKSAKPGVPGPSAPGTSDIPPAEQKQYFNYKIQELQSRIQLVQFMLSKGSPDNQQKAQAQKDMAAWNKELSDYQKVLAQVPEK